jgi:hypothetical protein
MAEVRETHRLLVQVLLPHEAAEDTLLYPAVRRVLGGYDPTLPMSRTHAEIRRGKGTARSRPTVVKPPSAGRASCRR